MPKKRKSYQTSVAKRGRLLKMERLENRRLLAGELTLSNNFVHEKLPVDSLAGQLTATDPLGILPFAFELVAGTSDDDQPAMQNPCLEE